MNSCNMVTHFATIKAGVIRSVNGFTVGTHGAQDWDLFLKISAKTNNIIIFRKFYIIGVNLRHLLL